MSTQLEELKELSFASKMENVSLIEDLVDNVCRTQSVGEDYYGNILIAVTEAVNNAIQHGNKNVASKIVVVNVSKELNRLTFRITDEGKGFSFDSLPDPTAPENIEKESGRGIFLMKALTDEVAFEQNGSKVVLTFIL